MSFTTLLLTVPTPSLPTLPAPHSPPQLKPCVHALTTLKFAQLPVAVLQTFKLVFLFLQGLCHPGGGDGACSVGPQGRGVSTSDACKTRDTEDI